MGIDSLDGITNTIKANPTGAALLGGAIVAGLGAATGLALSGKKKRSKRSWQLDRKKRSKQKWEVAYQKRKKKKKKSSKRKGKIHYAKKTGQPYILLANGRAKFIKGKRRKR